MKSMRKAWVKTEIDELIDLHNNGKDYKEIAKIIGRNKNSVYSKLKNIKGLKIRHKRTGNYLFEVGEIINGLKIIEKTKNEYNRKAYKVQSITFPDASKYIVRESDLKSGKGDAYVKGLRVCEGNSLYSVNHIRPYIVNKEEAKYITMGSNIIIDVKCPDCEYRKRMIARNLARDGFSCPHCSSNITYGQLAFMCYQNYFDLKYIPEKVLLELPNRRFDFVKINERNEIINIVEIQGSQHSDTSHRWYEKAKKQDREKRVFAKENNILLIELDMRISNWEYFKKQIKKCEYLPNINKDDEKIILKTMEKNKRYPIKEIILKYEDGYTMSEIGKEYNVSRTTISNILKKNNYIKK